MGRLLLPEPKDATHQVAVTVGVRANAKQAAGLWRAKERENCWMARGGFNMPEEIKRQLKLFVLDNVADVSDPVTRQLKTLSELSAEDFVPPVPAGERRPSARTGCASCGRSRKIFTEDDGSVLAAPVQHTLRAFSKGS